MKMQYENTNRISLHVILILCFEFPTVSYHTVKAAQSGNPGKLAAAEIITLTYTSPPRKGALNDIPQLMKDTANLFSGNKNRKLYEKGIRFHQRRMTGNTGF